LWGGGVGAGPMPYNFARKKMGVALLACRP